jgi:hypothetical protein
LERYYDNGDGTITDNNTGLMWMKDVDYHGTTSWYNAVTYCNNLTYAGHSDWQLPYSFDLVFHTPPFIDVPAGWLAWTSQENGDNAMAMSLSTYSYSNMPKSTGNIFVIPVRYA